MLTQQITCPVCHIAQGRWDITTNGQTTTPARNKKKQEQVLEGLISVTWADLMAFVAPPSV